MESGGSLSHDDPNIRNNATLRMAVVNVLTNPQLISDGYWKGNVGYSGILNKLIRNKCGPENPESITFKELYKSIFAIYSSLVHTGMQ
jgi:hypothetical protein